MKRFLPLMVIVSFGALICLGAWFSPALATASQDESAVAETEMDRQMEIIEEGLKKLRRSLRKEEKNAESLEWIAKIQDASLKSKLETPKMAVKIPEDQRAKFVADYRKEMAVVVIRMCEMEIAVLDGDLDKAQGLYKQLKSLEDSGHEKFLEEE